MINPWLSSVAFDAIFPDGTRRQVTFRIGIPYSSDAEPGEWLCAVALDGLVANPDGDVPGAEAMQALCLALSWAGRELRRLNESGIAFVDRGEVTEFTWHDYFDVGLDREETERQQERIREQNAAAIERSQERRA